MPSEIESINWIKDIFIPLLSAFIGGFITLAGVWLTIHREKKRDEERRIQEAKPWIFNMDDCENFDCKKANDIVITESRHVERKFGITFLIKNTDNGVAIIDRYETETKKYVPIVGGILDKNSISYVHVFPVQGDTLNDMYLYIKDIYGNEYKYRAHQGDISKKCGYIEEVKVKKRCKNGKQLYFNSSR